MIPKLVLPRGGARLLAGLVMMAMADGAMAMAVTAQTPAPPVAHATRTTEAPRIDGVLDEDVWAAAIPISEFTQLDPEEGRLGSEPTIVRILYDDEALYVGALLRDSHPVSTRLARRDDDVSASDWFSIAIDSYRDFRTAYEFRVNPSGVRGDQTLTGDSGDDSWDPVWSAASRITEDGWSVEMRIPFSQLRFRPADEQLWGLQIQREIARRQEVMLFAFTPKSERAGIARYGVLSGLRGLAPGDRLELAPYVVGRASVAEVDRNPAVSFADPFRDEHELGSRIGLDLKYRITSNLTLDATVNPDFGQVEADPAEVNLTAFESRFSERRPFFVEGNDIFSFGGGGWGGVNLFYSRRIGGPPPVGSVPGAAYADVPDATTILGAAKMTGRTQGGWAIGMLNAVTGAESARFIDGDGEIGKADVAPLANHLVARARRETNEGRTSFGGIVTAVNRVMDDGRLAQVAREDAYAAGVDFRHEWADRSWAAHGYFIGSMIGGAPEVILEAQRSPARYYQRADADHLSLDPDATSLSGYAGRLQLSKQAGEHWRGNVMTAISSPGFEVNDLGYHYDADRIFVDTRLDYVDNEPGDLFRRWSIGGGPGAQWNYAGDLTWGSSSINLDGLLTSYWSIGGSVRHAIATYDDRLTRGGPMARRPAETGYSFEIESDPRRRVSGEFDVGYSHDTAGGWETSLRTGMELRPAPNWSISIDPEYRRSRRMAQYVGTIADVHAADTYGARYLFAPLSQTVLSVRTRLDLVFSPALTLETYLEPFLASGDYGEVGELAAPRSFDFRTYGAEVGSVTPSDGGVMVDPDGDGPAEQFFLPDRDFRRGSLNGNAVLRWEWRPGSTIFLVWQHSREAFRDEGRFAFGPGVRELWDERPDHVLLVKVSYWFSR